MYYSSFCELLPYVICLQKTPKFNISYQSIRHECPFVCYVGGVEFTSGVGKKGPQLGRSSPSDLYDKIMK